MLKFSCLLLKARLQRRNSTQLDSELRRHRHPHWVTTFRTDRWHSFTLWTCRQLDVELSWVELNCVGVAIDTSPTQLNSTSSWVELCRYKRAFRLWTTKLNILGWCKTGRVLQDRQHRTRSRDSNQTHQTRLHLYFVRYFNYSLLLRLSLIALLCTKGLHKTVGTLYMIGPPSCLEDLSLQTALRTMT